MRAQWDLKYLQQFIFLFEHTLTIIIALTLALNGEVTKYGNVLDYGNYYGT